MAGKLHLLTGDKTLNETWRGRQYIRFRQKEA
jgi:hypothetical protein